MSITRLMLYAGIVIVGTVAGTSAYNYMALTESRIGGESFARIEHGQGFIADYLPPPLVPYEALVMVHNVRDATNGSLSEAIDKWAKLHASFEERLAHWDRQMAESPFLDAGKYKSFRDGIASHGRAFWDKLEREIIPALQTGDLTAADIAIGQLTANALAFSDFVSSSSGFVDEATQRVEDDSLAASNLALTVAGVLAIVLVSALIALLYAGNRFVVRALAAISRTMHELSHGKLAVAVPFEGRKDEVGSMARSVVVFRTQAQQNDAARTENEAVIRALGAGLDNMAKGDLTAELNAPFPQSLDALRLRFNETLHALRDIIAAVRTGSEGIKVGTEEIAVAADDLSRRTESQAASLEQTSAAVAEIAQKVKSAATGAIQARTVVEAAKAEADRSGTVVNRAVSAMQGIEQSSKQISRIISVIDEIAFQTNLLALNAGVEAARAGDAGRGFAVVATEVRALAQRSAEAAREIKELLSQSEAAVGQGVGLVAEAGTSLSAIIDRVAEINKIVSDIAADAEYQATGLQEVNVAVEQMDMATQQNAAMVEETTATTRTLSEQSADLAEMVSRFKVAVAA